MASYKIAVVLVVAFAAMVLGAEQSKAAAKDLEASDLKADSTYGLGYALGGHGYPYGGYYGSHGGYGSYPYYSGYSKYSLPYTSTSYHGNGFYGGYNPQYAGYGGYLGYGGYGHGGYGHGGYGHGGYGHGGYYGAYPYSHY